LGLASGFWERAGAGEAVSGEPNSLGSEVIILHRPELDAAQPACRGGGSIIKSSARHSPRFYAGQFWDRLRRTLIIYYGSHM